MEGHTNTASTLAMMYAYFKTLLTIWITHIPYLEILKTHDRLEVYFDTMSFHARTKHFTQKKDSTQRCLVKFVKKSAQTPC